MHYRGLNGSKYLSRLMICSLASFILVAPNLFALPFNDDMTDVQMRTGTSMRSSVAGTKPIGASTYSVKDKASTESLKNPVKATQSSIENGRRLFGINCSPCHGTYKDDKTYVPGVVNKFLPGPDVTADLYKGRSDGFFYGTIHFGGIALMPAYGWRLSPQEHWDIVNYIRTVQKGR